MATQTKVIGPISAYAIAVQEGYTGSKAEWAEAIGNAQANAAAAEAAADRVQNLTESLPDDFTDTIANFAPTYSTSSTYAVGDYVIHYGSLYRCITKITTAEAWTPAHWVQVNVGGEVSDLKSALRTAQQYTGYWYQKLVIPANTAHQATSDRLDVDIRNGADYCIVFKMDGMYRPQIYAVYDDNTSDRIYINASSTFWSGTIKRTASKHIVKLGLALSGTSSPQRTIELLVFTADSASWLFGYGTLTTYFIRRPDGLLCFERGRARADVDTLHQSIAVYDNQVWEFGEGKAAYNGITYELANGHANCCNWGKELHGTYPYLYCPKTTDKDINVFSFDGSAFTLANTITIASDVTGNLNAYVDEKNGYIYGFIGADTYFVADMTGAILETKTLRYKIQTIQNIKLHDGILYVVSGYGTQASPNYMSIVSTDGTMLGKYQMSGFGEIEGVDFLDNKMILATYYEFYINPVLVPETKYFGYTNQLKATT